tara:strand:+ start:1876 stop:2469 length:594 start_codon:yes stop_codon:yes gene_type:complete
MLKKNKFFIKVFLLLFFTVSITTEIKALNIGKENAKIVVKVFSSLTCPHCANFHTEIFNRLNDDFIKKNLLKFEHHAFPLDLAALNAEIIVRCHENNNKSFQLLGEIYEKQNQWAVGSDINYINDSIKKIGEKFGLSKNQMEKCLKNDEVQDNILNERIEAQKKYKIQSTPTIYINEKKYKGKHKYEEFKKEIEKLL